MSHPTMRAVLFGSGRLQLGDIAMGVGQLEVAMFGFRECVATAYVEGETGGFTEGDIVAGRYVSRDGGQILEIWLARIERIHPKDDFGMGSIELTVLSDLMHHPSERYFRLTIGGSQEGA